MTSHTAKFTVNIGTNLSISCNDAESLREALKVAQQPVAAAPAPPVAPASRKPPRSPRIASDLQSRFTRLLRGSRNTNSGLLIDALTEAPKHSLSYQAIHKKIRATNLRAVAMTAGSISRAAKKVGLDPSQVMQKVIHKETHEPELVLSGKFAAFLSRQHST